MGKQHLSPLKCLNGYVFFKVGHPKMPGFPFRRNWWFFIWFPLKQPKQVPTRKNRYHPVGHTDPDQVSITENHREDPPGCNPFQPGRSLSSPPKSRPTARRTLKNPHEWRLPSGSRETSTRGVCFLQVPTGQPPQKKMYQQIHPPKKR